VEAIGIEAENAEDSEELVEGRGQRRWRWKNPVPLAKRKPTPHMGRCILFDDYNPN